MASGGRASTAPSRSCCEACVCRPSASRTVACRASICLTPLFASHDCDDDDAGITASLAWHFGAWTNREEFDQAARDASFLSAIVDQRQALESLLDQLDPPAPPAAEDNLSAPEFVDDDYESTTAYIVSVAETTPVGGAFARPIAWDADPGDVLSFAIAAGNGEGLFAIDPTTGELSVAAPLDAAASPEHVLTITATDAAGHVDSATVAIGVLGNISMPLFDDATGMSGSVEILDTAVPGELVAAVRATDADPGDDAT